MSNIILYIAQSLDGYIARPDGNLDWLDNMPNPDQNDHGYAALLDQIEATIMGRETYQKVLSFGIEWPYTGLHSYIVTSNPALPIASPDTSLMLPDIAEAVTKLKANSTKDIWLIGGGQLVTYFLNQGLIDRMILTIIPTIIGEGVPLFPNKPLESWWKLEKTEAFASGAVSLTYNKI